MRLAGVPVPDTPVAVRAVDAAGTYCSPALMQHNHRSYLWAAALGAERGLDFDAELPEDLRAEVLAAHPRLDLAAEFLACFTDQAKRKPASSPASALTHGLATRIRSNVLDKQGA